MVAVVTGKCTLWTNAGVDQNFQRDLRAVGPYEFEKEIRVDQWPLNFVKSFP